MPGGRWVAASEARELFVDALAHRNRYGLLSEDIAPEDRDIVGQFSADLFDGRTDLDRDAAVAKLGGPILARLVVVSNRVAVPNTDGSGRAGGLAVAVRALLKQHAGPLVRLERDASPPNATRDAAHSTSGGLSYVVTDLAEEDYQEYYNGFANRVLWPILHYRLDLAEFTRRDLSGYCGSMSISPTELNNLLQADDVVWVHDYHLIPLAKMLRDRGHRNRIGFFLHIPFPPPEILTALPNHEWLIPQLSAYDLVGFQTQNDAANLLATSRMNAAWSGAAHPHTRRPTGPCGIGAFPVGIETAEFSAAGAALGALGVRAQRARQSRRPRHDDRRRPPRLLQGAGPAHGRLRPVPHGLSGLARQGHLSSDHAQEPLRDPGICRNGAHHQRGRGTHQRRLWRSRLDADPLRQPCATAGACWRASTARRGSGWSLPCATA